MRYLLVISLLGFSAPTNAAMGNISGLWLSQKQDAHIRIYDCGNGTPCGKLSWVDSKKSSTIYDARNPVQSKKSRKLIGVPIAWGYKRKDNKWHGGKIYNPEDGKTFRSNMRLLNVNKLQVKGCLGPFCRTNIWTRVSGKNAK